MWAGSFVYTDGPWRIGLCADDRELIDVAVRAVPGSLTETDVPPPGYSLIAHPERMSHAGGSDVARELPSLRRGFTTLLRSRDPARLAASLALHLVSHPASPLGRVRLRTAAVTQGDSVVLVPAHLLWQAGVERRLTRAGITPIDTPVVEIDERSAWITQLNADRRCFPIRRWLLDPLIVTGRDSDTASGLLAAACTQIDPGSGAHPHDALTAVDGLRALMTPLPEDLTASGIVTAMDQAFAT